jgi:hypothetical protein
MKGKIKYETDESWGNNDDKKQSVLEPMQHSKTVG